MTYPVNVRGVLESLAATRVVTGEIVIPDVELGEQLYAFLEPVRFEVTLTNTGEGIVASGTAGTTVRTPCVRCLREFDLPVAGEVEGFYIFPGHDDQMPEEQEFAHIAEDSSVDIEPAVAQCIVVDLPFAPLHDVDCKGICAVCGGDRNLDECTCSSEVPDPPFAGLKDLLASADEAPGMS